MAEATADMPPATPTSARPPRLSSPCCSSLGAASWAQPFALSPRSRPATQRKQARSAALPTPAALRTVDVAWAVSPRVTAAEVLHRHEHVMRNCEELTLERSRLFATIQQVHTRQLAQRNRAAAQEKAQRTLRLHAARTARPAYGTYEYASPK